MERDPRNPLNLLPQQGNLGEKSSRSPDKQLPRPDSSPDPSQQRVMPPEMQGWIPTRFGQGGNKHSQVSEDDLSTGIYEEAKHQLPNALMELDRPRKHA